jgi:hypothetical protein
MSAGDGGSGGDGPTTRVDGDPIPLVLDGRPAHFRHVRLTHQQWENSVRDNLRLPGATAAAPKSGSTRRESPKATTH